MQKIHGSPAPPRSSPGCRNHRHPVTERRSADCQESSMWCTRDSGCGKLIDKGKRLLLPLFNRISHHRHCAQHDHDRDQKNEPQRKSRLAAEGNHAQRHCAAQQTPAESPSAENTSPSKSELDHRVIHAVSRSLLLCTLATKISSRVIVSTACTAAPSSLQTETMAGSNRSVVSTGSRPLPPTSTTPGSRGT